MKVGYREDIRYVVGYRPEVPPPKRTAGSLDFSQKKSASFLIPSEKHSEPETTYTNKIQEIQHKVNSELDQYLMFEEGWDGYYGEEFEDTLIIEMKEWLQKIVDFFEEEGLVPDKIIPGPASDGSIDLEVVYKDKTLLLTRYPDETRIEVFSESQEESKEEEFEVRELNLEEKLIWLIN